VSVLFERSNRSTEPWISDLEVELSVEAVALEVSVEPLFDIVPGSVPVLLVPLLDVDGLVDEGVLSVDDGVLPMEPLRVSSVFAVDDDPVVLPLL